MHFSPSLEVHPYIVNERLFTQPFKSGLIDYGDTDEKDRHRETEKKAPTEENPRFVRYLMAFYNIHAIEGNPFT